MRVLVTGGAGFIGSHVVDALVERGDDVVVLDRAGGAVNPGAGYVRGDVRSVDAWLAAIGDGVDAVSHQAARVGLGVDFDDVTDYVEHNDLGTAVGLRALRAAGFRGRLVLASSMVVYGEGSYECSEHGPVRPDPRDERDLAAGRYEPRCPACGADVSAVTIDEAAALDPRNVYAATKLHQEHLCSVFGREHGLPVVALRYHNVYGPRMPRSTPYAGVAAIFCSALASGEPPRVFEDGGQSRDFVHVADVARANVLALTVDGPAGAFNIASGEPHTVLEMATALHAGFGADPELAPRVAGGYRLGDVRHVVASPRRAEEELGFRAAVPFADGMRELATASATASARSRLTARAASRR
jgi:dTDP-L-rhamnose 4-epimerase